MPLLFLDKLSETEFLSVWKIEESSDFLLKKNKLTSSEKVVYNSFKNESRKIQWLSCRILVNEFMKNNGLKGNIYYDEKGKPHLTTGHFISISHTPYFAAIIINKNKAVGIDIEKISERILKVKNRMASDNELKITGDNLEHLTTLWASKEAIYKICGINDLSFNNDIFVDLSKIKNNNYNARVSHQTLNKNYFLKREVIEDHILVYVIDI